MQKKLPCAIKKTKGVAIFKKVSIYKTSYLEFSIYELYTPFSLWLTAIAMVHYKKAATVMPHFLLN